MEDRYGLKAASECDNIIREYCRGSRPNAKKSLKQIAKQTGAALPRRYLARLIYHDAAGSISPGTVGSGSSMKRIQLLQEAYEHAVEATSLAPNSLSCAALRATLAINLLVEESALLNPSNKPAKKGQGMSALEKKCQELRERFRGSIDACRTALEHPSPVMVEPVITMITATHTTCDPCSLLQEKILEWFKNGSWQEILAEKRSVLTSMQQVLQSCYALLDSTQVPVNSIIKLLQHILRPDGAEQQMLASSRVGSGAAAGNPPANGTQMPLPTAQLHHAAIGELLRLLRPASGTVPPVTAAADCDTPQAAVAAAADTNLAPLPLSVEKPWGDDKATATAAAPKAAAGSGAARGKGRGSKGRAAAAGALKKKERTRRERFMDVESFWRSCSPEQRMQLLQVPLAPLLEDVKQESGSEAAEELMEGLVLLREQANTSARYWLCAACERKFHTASDFSAHLEACHEQLVLIKQAPPPQQQHPGAGMMYKPGQIAAAIAAGVAAAGGASATAAAAAGADAAAAVAAAVAEGGPNSVLAQAAQLQQQQQQQAQPSFISGQAPLTYVTCSKCQCEVVGMYFSSVQPPVQQQQPPVQPHQLCLKCYRLVSGTIGAEKASQSYARIAPHAPVLGCSAWSESGSEFISTRDSFSSCDVSDDELNNDLDNEAIVAQLSSSRHDPLKLPATKGQLTAQQQRQLAWLSAAVNRGLSSVQAQQQQQQQLQTQQQQQQLKVQQAPPAPGMFVFSSKGTSSSNTASAAAAANALPASSTALPGPARLPAAASVPAPMLNVGADSLSHELIAELEAVHAARKVFLQGQPAAAAAAAAPFLQQAAAYSQQTQRQRQGGAGGTQPALAPVGTGRQQDGVADSNDGRSSATAAAAGQDMGTPTASGRTWRDWLLPKKLLQWSEGEEGQESAGWADHDEMHLCHGGTDAHSADVCQVHSAAVHDTAGPSLHRRHSDSTTGLTPCSNSRRQQLRQQGQGQAVGGSSSSAPCSPRTPAAKDSRQQQGEIGAAATADAGAAAGGAATVELDSPENLTLVRVQAAVSSPPMTTAAPGGLTGSLPQAGLPALNKAGAARQQLQQRFEHGTNAAVTQADASMAVAGQQVLVDEIIRCMAQVYAADKDVADMTLGCLVDFVRRKLLPASSTQAAAPAGPRFGAGSVADDDSAYFSSSSSRDSSPATSSAASMALAAAAPNQVGLPASNANQPQLPTAAALLPPHELQLVQQFLASPAAAYLSPEMMRATLCCLPASDLQMALAYVVRQHEDTMTQTGHSDSDADTSSQSVAAEDDAGCMPLFQLHHLDELSFEQLVEHIWPGELEDGSEAAAPTAAAATANSCGSKPGAGNSGKGVKGQQQLRQKQVVSAAAQRGGGTGAAAGSATVSALAESKPLQDQPKLLPASWWVEHLQQSSKAADPLAVAAGDHRILRWVYGNIVSSQAEEFAAGQAALRCNLDRHTALLELYEGMANAWRRMQRVADKRRMLEQLRQNIKTQFGVVRSQEEAGEHCTGQQAITFLEALFTSLCTTNSSNKASSSTNNADGQLAGARANNDAAAAAKAGTWPGSVSLSPPPSLCLTAPPLGASQLQPEPPGLANQAGPDDQAPVAAAAGAAAATALVAAGNAAVSQLQVRLNQLAPLYLCEPAVEVVRQAPALAREASQRYARALLERELAVLALIEAMLDDDVQAARQKLAGANERLVARRSELSTAEAEHSRLVAEGPASHRKKDFLDKATKEAEHREKLADLKVKIDAAKAAIAEDEVTAAAADLAAADATGDLGRVREQARQIAARQKNLEDLNTQLSAPVPPLTEAALAAAVSSSAAIAGAGLGMLPGPGAATAAAFAAAVTGSSGCSCCPPLPAGTPALQQPTALVTTSSGSNNGTTGADLAAISTAAELGWSWRAQRLECLMYRVLWVAEAVKLFQAQYEPRGKQYELLVRASKWVKERCDEYDLTFQAAAEDLSNLRNRVQQLACVDLTFDINGAALKYIRKSIEAEAARVQELRSQNLLLELAAEEEAKKAQQAAQQQQQNADAAGSNTGCTSGSTAASGTPGKNAKGKKGRQGTASGKDQLQKQQQQQQLSEQERKVQEAAAKQMLEEARRAREAALEAELEQRRRELEQLEAQREAELIKQAQEVSLREQQALKRAQEASMREQQALADAAAVLAAAAGSGDMSLLKVSSSSSCAGADSATSAATGGKGQQAKSQKMGNKASANTAAGTATSNVGAAANLVAQRGKGQHQHAAVLPQPPPPPPPPAAGKAASWPASTNRTAAAAAQGHPSAAPTPSAAAAVGRAGKASLVAAAPAGAASTKQQHARQPAAAGAARKGKHSTTGPGTAGASSAAAAADSALQHAQHAGKQQHVPHPGPPTAGAVPAPPYSQTSQQPAPSLLDFGPTPAEAYAAAAAAKEQHTVAAGAKGQQQQQPGHQRQPPPPPRRPASGPAAQEADGVRISAHAEATQQAAVPTSAPAVAPTGDQPVQAPAAATGSIQPPAAAAPAVPCAGLGLSTRDEVVHMPASGVGSSSHLSQLSLSHGMDASDTTAASAASALGGQPASLASSSSGLGMGSFGGLNLSRGAGSLPLPPSVSLHATGGSSSARGMAPLLSAASAGSAFDPFGGSYGPPDALLLQQASAFGTRQVQQQQQVGQAGTVGGQQQQPERPAALQLQSAGSAPLGTDLGVGAMLSSHLGAHAFGGPPASGTAGGRPSLDITTATGPSSSESNSSSRPLLPPRPSTACSNLMVGAGVAQTAGSSALGGFAALEPGSPLQLGSSPADAPHIQSIMSLLDGDTGLSSRQQQQQQDVAGVARTTSSSPARGKQHNAKSSAKQRPGSADKGANCTSQRQQQQRLQQLPHSPSAGNVASWEGSRSALGSRCSSNGSAAVAAVGPIRGPAAGVSEREQQQGHLTSPPGLRPGSQASVGARAGGDALPPRPGSASSSTGAESAAGYPNQQQQQPQAWLQQQQMGGYGGVSWGALAPGADAAGLWGAALPPAAAPGAKDRRSSSGGHLPQQGSPQAMAAGFAVKTQGTPAALPTATVAAGGQQFGQAGGTTATTAGSGAPSSGRRPAQHQHHQQILSPVASAAPFGATTAAAAMSPAGSRGINPVVHGGSPGFPAQAINMNAANLAAAAAAAATAAVTKVRQQASAADAAAAALAYGDVGLNPYSAASGLGGVGLAVGTGLGAAGAFGGSRNVLGAGSGGVPPGAAASSGFGVYAGGMGVSVPGFGSVATPGVLSPHLDGRAGVLGQFASPQGAFGGAVTGSQVGSGLWGGWPQGTLPQQQQAAAAAMAAAMHQQQQQMLAGRGTVASAGLPGLWQPLQQQQQHPGRLGQQQ